MRYRWLLILILLAACANPPAPVATPLPPTAPPPASATPQPPTRQPATATPAPTSAPERPLLLWAIVPETRREAFAQLMRDAAHIAGVEVTIEFRSADGVAAEVRAAQLTGGALPDLVWGSQDDLGILQRAGALQPADDGIAESGMLAATIAGAQVAGERWGTPLAAQGALLLLYNRKLTDGAPRTTDALAAEARRLTGGGRYGIVAGWAEPRWFSAWLVGAGAPSVELLQLDTPETLAALETLRALRAAGPPPPSSYADGVRLFREGRAAFAIDGDWSIERYRTYTDTLDLGIAPMPIVSSTSRTAAGPLGGIYLMYGARLTPQQMEEASALGALLTTPIFQSRIAANLGLLPALRAALADPAVAADPALAAAAATAEAAPGLPPTDELRCAWAAIENVLPAFLLGDLEAEDTPPRIQEIAAACATG
jgi:ABC-type glycerol-3-phosphate transport system substrate-binding protein